ncbi:MAG: helix-turn-helix domain-containing protein [Candidatus Marinimicrobia bacterium]|nr:helix-turn-helix domain-containing protein [Candidatus Neomarinimicrobiota bacterium]
MSKLYTTNEAARYLGVTPSRIRQYIAEERLKSEKYGRDHMIKERDLEYFARDGKKKRGRPPKTKK